MTTPSSSIPTYILLSTHTFPSPSSHSSSSSSSSSTLSSPSSIVYHFTSDGPFDPLPHLSTSSSSSKRVLVWDARTEEVTSLSSEVAVGEKGVRKEGGANEKEGGEGSAVWVVDLQEGPRLGEEEDSGASIEELLEVLKKQEELLAKFGSKKEEGRVEGGDGEERS